MERARAIMVTDSRKNSSQCCVTGEKDMVPGEVTLATRPCTDLLTVFLTRQ